MNKIMILQQEKGFFFGLKYVLLIITDNNLELEQKHQGDDRKSTHSILDRSLPMPR